MIPITGQTQAAYLDAPGSGKAAPTAEQTAEGPGFQPFGADGFTFEDFIDIINPLQHIPIVSTFYRQLTGDDLDPGSRIGGGTLFGGPIGLVASAINVLIDETTGKDMGEQVLALFDGGGPASSAKPEAVNAPVRTAEMADPAGGPLWSNPDAGPDAGPGAGPYAEGSPPGEPSFVTAGGPAEAISPISEGIDVLVWAQLETANRQRAEAAQAAIRVSNISRRVTAMQMSQTQMAALAGSIGASPYDAESLAGPSRPPDAAASLSSQAAAASLSSQAAGRPLGGWFSDVMLSALTKYQAGGGLIENREDIPQDDARARQD